MGSWLFNQLEQSGFSIKGIDRNSPEVLEEFADNIDIMILAVPFESLHDVTRIVGPVMNPSSLLMDITSLKEEPVRQMLNNSVCEVIGAHPMFGPSAESFAGQLCYISPARSEHWLPKVEKQLLNMGARVRIISPEKHDRLMATVQTLRHVALTSLGLTLKQTGFDLEKDLDISGQWFQDLARMMIHQFEQPSGLYAELALNNRHSKEILQNFRLNNDRVIDKLSEGDRSSLTEFMDTVRSYTRSV